MVKENDQTTAISLEENFTAADEHRVSALIVQTITADLTQVTERENRLYFIVPTPTPYRVAEEEMLREIGVYSKNKTAADGFMRVTRLRNGATCYVISGTSIFLKVIPLAFRLGPPEVTFFAANCPFGIGVALDELSDYVLAALKADRSSGCEFIGMHFDSGDLMDTF